MSDELDVLRHDHDVIEPDPQFRAELMDRLRHDMASGSDLAPSPLTLSPAPGTAAQGTSPSPVQIGDAASPGPRQHGRRWLVAVAAATMLLAATTAVIQYRDRDPELETSSDSADPFEDLTTPNPTQVFTDVAPGSTVELPPAPGIPREVQALVWTGTEMLVLGDLVAGGASVGDGAAFDLATGTWRVIAPSPLAYRAFAEVVWTGTEMFVWGGDADGNPGFTDGATYNPTTDTWRRLPEAPIDSASGQHSVWTGDEVIVLGGGESANQAAAYDPEQDEWRRLADAPRDISREVLWTGDMLLATVGSPDLDARGASELVRYDLSADEWQTVAAEVTYASLLAVPDADGVVRALLALPADTGAPVTVLDRAGNPIGALPAFPGESATFGDQIAADGVWLGEEALFSVRGADWLFSAQGTAEVWALHPATQTWRQLDADELPPDHGLERAVEAGIFVGWVLSSEEPDAPFMPVAYRPPTPAGG